ncbi:universal stress protein [Actinomycetospora cinnamomea]|uniref:Universal stress protein family protein n=1 Tax=Actinomycetospora cinnamomea TaxID=663609 RepID=A0A2U1F449_9PSEU|nr:universal stress protein [Actinomycetospora cinnamomea]PVZ06929.1 universal stress protein family protein [Actinomycetospora cinnamomea]
MSATHETPGPRADRRVVVGLADDDASWAALCWALTRAARGDGAVHAVRAVRGGDRDGITSACSGGSDRAVAEVEATALRRLAGQVAGGVGGPTPPVSLSWCRGRPADVLSAVARDADAVVVGRPGRRDRTVRALVDRAPCPVAIVPPGFGARPRPRHVVVGVDATSDPTAAGVAPALEEALCHARIGDRVTVVAAIDPAPAVAHWPRGLEPSPTADEQAHAAREATRAVVGPAVEQARHTGAADPGVAVAVIGRPEAVDRAVLGAARDLEADEVVVPRTAHWSAARLLRLARVAPCALTVVPDRRADRSASIRETISPPRTAPARGIAGVSRAAAR